MDPRIRRHAEILVDHCTDVRHGDMVEIRATPPAEDLIVALYAELGKRGARPTVNYQCSRARRAYDREMDPGDYVTAEHRLAATEQADVVFMIRGTENTREASDVSAENRQAAQRAQQPIMEARLDTRWVITQYPTSSAAQQAEMSTAAYEQFVWNAVNKDWAAQREHQEQLIDLLDPTEEIRIVAGDETDLTLDVSGMYAGNDYGEMNLPGGEVYTVPNPDGVEGTVKFDMPLIFQGHEIEGAYLEFEGGEVVDFDADAHAGVLESVLAVDEGASRLGELGFGMNRDIDQFTYNTLFDEKMGDTVHLAVGDAIDECVPVDREANESAVHLDMLVDMSEDSRVEFDGTIVQRDGTFVFEA